MTVGSRFPPGLWAEGPSTLKRTNNSAEAFHSHFNAQFYSAHPSLFVFMDVLQNVQATTYLKMRSTDQAVTARKEDKTRSEFAISQNRKYSSREITRLEYIKSLGYRFMPRMDYVLRMYIFASYGSALRAKVQLYV